MNMLTVLLQQTAQPGGGGMSILMMIMIIFVFYFFMMRPQMKKQKELRNFRASLQKGDKVVTTGGIYGKIVEIQDAFVVIDIADKVYVKVDKFAVLKDSSDLSAGQK